MCDKISDEYIAIKKQVSKFNILGVVDMKQTSQLVYDFRLYLVPRKYHRFKTVTLKLFLIALTLNITAFLLFIIGFKPVKLLLWLDILYGISLIGQFIAFIIIKFNDNLDINKHVEYYKNILKNKPKIVIKANSLEDIDICEYLIHSNIQIESYINALKNYESTIDIEFENLKAFLHMLGENKIALLESEVNNLSDVYSRYNKECNNSYIEVDIYYDMLKHTREFRLNMDELLSISKKQKLERYGQHDNLKDFMGKEPNTSNKKRKQRCSVHDALVLFMLSTPFTLRDLKSARNTLMKAYHTDQSKTDTTRQAVMVNEAYEVLKEYAIEQGYES